MKVWKRCMAAVLSFVIFFTNCNISIAAGTYDAEDHIWTGSKAEIVADYYGLDSREKDILQNKSIDRGYEHILFTPYDNETKGKKNMVAVDYVNKKIYAKAKYTGGCSWLPETAVLSAEGEEVETLTLTQVTCFYDGVEYSASQAFTYNGNSYKVEVRYKLYVEVSQEEQTRLLEIPMILAQTSRNLETNLIGLRMDAGKLGEMTPALAELLTLELPKKAETETSQTAVTDAGETEVTPEEGVEAESEEAAGQQQTLPKEPEIVMEPAFDPVEQAAEIQAIKALRDQYQANNALTIYKLSDEYRTSGKGILEFTFEKGARILQESEELYGYVVTLKESSRLKQVCRELYNLNPELYDQLRYLQVILKGLVGTTNKPGELTGLQDADNWKILGDDVKARIFADSYSKEDFEALESMMYGLKNSKMEMPVIESETLVATEVGASCKITTCQVNVTLKAETTSGELEDGELYELEPFTTTLTLLEGTEKEALTKAIEKNGIEKNALSAWNAINSHYMINTANYNREENGLPDKLAGDLEYVISYIPKYYQVKTNFRGNDSLPYGYLMELPASTDEEISYEYIVENSDGAKLSLNEGVTYKITDAVTISQQEGSEKTEYRLYDFLINDSRYAMSDEVKEILSSAAVNSPTLKIRVPDGSTVGEVICEDGVYRIEAEDFGAGILGMKWEPYMALVMDGEELLEEVEFHDGVATWTTGGFTHVRVSYRLKIEKVKDGIMNRPLDETEDVLYALNLPDSLVKHTVEQNFVLSGEKGVTVKNIYKEMTAVADMMGNEMIRNTLPGAVETDDAKDGVLQLFGSEQKIIKGQKNQTLGYGAWNTANDELALYSYLKLCADTNWSLAAFYEKGLYQKVKEQSVILADCLEKVIRDPKFLRTLESVGMTNKVQQIEKLIPALRELAEKISGPHPAINMESEGFTELIERLLSMEGTTSSIDSSDGIYAYTSIRRNGERGGSLTVSVQVGSKMAKTREISYIMEDNSHNLTEEEAAKVQEYITELEALCGMTEEEKMYYDVLCTSIPKAGDSVKKNEIVSLNYQPKKYSVTIAGVPSSEYEQTFKYKSDYVITLPAYSSDAEDSNYVRYWIDEETSVKVANGTEGYYAFTKEDLTTRFVDGHYEIRMEVIERLSGLEVSPSVVTNGELIRGSASDLENKILYLDSTPEGLTEAQFKQLVKFNYGDGKTAEITIENANRDPANQKYLANGSEVCCLVEDDNGDIHENWFTVIIMGDVNKNGKVDSNDISMIVKNYLGDTGEQETDEAAGLAADMNRNKKLWDSNDALQIMKKISSWSEETNQYKSVLNK